jgi:N-acyl-D-aspartate/D-glutamate deacylase
MTVVRIDVEAAVRHDHVVITAVSGTVSARRPDCDGTTAGIVDGGLHVRRQQRGSER